MLAINPYLHFMGNTEEAMIFYKKIFGGEFNTFQRYNDVPGFEKMPMEEQNKMIHVSLTIGNGITIMATDALESMGRNVNAGNNFYICVQAESVSETDRLFAELSKGGLIEMPLNETMWGAYFGMCRDKFGVHWMINFTYPRDEK